MVRRAGVDPARDDEKPPRAAASPVRITFARGLLVGGGALLLLTAPKLLFSQYIGAPTPFRLYFIAVLAAAWYGGVGAGLVTTAAATALGLFLFVDPRSTLPVVQREIMPAVLFCLEGLAIAIVTARLQRERQRSWAAAAAARSTADQLDGVLTGVDDGITVQDSAGRLLYANLAAARISGFASPDELLRARPQDFVDRFEILREDGGPFPFDELPGRVVLRGSGNTAEQLVRFRVRGQAEDHFSMVRANAVPDEHGQLKFAINIFRDVTQKRAHEEAVRLGREWLSTALRSIGDAVITTDRDGVVTFMNPVAAQLTGWSADEARGRPLRDVFVIVHEETRVPVESPVERVLREGKIVGLANHTVLTHRSGGEVAIDDSAAPIRTDAGELAGVVLVFRDVSAKRREEERRSFLARAAQELSSSLDYETTLATVARLAVPTIADWCAVDMLDGERVKRLAVAHVDPAKIELVDEIQRRYPPDASAASGTPNILRTGAAEMIAEIPAQLLGDAARDDEHLRLIRQLALHSYIGVPIRRGERTLGAITFVTAESRRVYGERDLQLAQALADRAAVAVENALLYREAQLARRDAASERDRLRTLIMTSPTAIAVLRTRELVFDVLNDPCRRLAPGLEVGKRVRDIAVDARNVALLEHVFDTGEPWAAVEQPLTRQLPDGPHTQFTTLNVQPLRDASGAVDGVVVFAQDVTHEVEARQRVEAARAEAELANRSKDEFLAMLGHELRNPLAPILTALQLMQLRAGETLDHERHIIERQVKHVVRLVDDLLDVSRITRGKVTLERERIEIAEVIADAIEIASPLLEQGRHVLATQVPRHGLLVHADRLRMAQVIANLLTNAAKYTESGGHIDVYGERDGASVVVRVRDSGVGIAADMLPRVFDLFVQERQTIDRSRGGLGLGLTIVRNLVDLHGGQVSARSDGPGKGSEFVVSLPAASAEPSEPHAVATQPAARAPVVDGQRVLIVDDNEDAADMLAMVLRARGYDTRVAHDGPSALRTIEDFKPQAALLDIGLPVMDGFELARRLRALPELDGLRLIAVTGYGQDTDRRRSHDAGFDHHLVKPIDVGSVVALLDARAS